MSVAEVASEAGYSRSIVTHQFGGKDALLRAVAQHAQHAVREPTEELTGLDRLLALAGEYLTTSDPTQPLTRAFLVMWGEAAAGELVLQSLHRERDTWFRSVVIDAVGAGLADGSIRQGVDPAAYAYLLVGQLRGVGVQLLLSEDEDVRPAIRAECLEMTRRHLRCVPPAGA